MFFQHECGYLRVHSRLHIIPLPLPAKRCKIFFFLDVMEAKIPIKINGWRESIGMVLAGVNACLCQVCEWRHLSLV